MLSPRENLNRLFRRNGIADAAVDFSLCPIMVDKFERKFHHRDYVREFQFPIRNVYARSLLQPFTDWQNTYFKDVAFAHEVNFDILGVGHEKTPESMHMTRMHHPMRYFTSLAEAQNYPYPIFNPDALPDATKQTQVIHDQGLFAVGNMQCTIWERAWYMRGMENMMMGMFDEDPMTIYHLDKITEIAVAQASLYAQAGVDLIFLGDDIGMQHTIMMSLDMYRQYLKPRLANVIKAARVINPDVLIAYHSCGFVEPFIDDLIDAGIDILNPVQPECMDFAKIHAKYDNRLSFWGTLGTQTLFPFGTPEEVYAKTIENLSIAGPRGGLLAAPTHLVEPEVPLENILAYVSACHDFKPPSQE